MKDYKSIEEFTFDDCSKYLHENPDSKYREIVENRFETVKAETENLDDEAFSNAKTIADLKRYLETDFPEASKYLKKHVKEAEERLRIMIKEAEENVQKKKRAKRIKIGIISALAFLALAFVCWLTYHPATYLSVSDYDGIVSKYGNKIQLTYESDANLIEVESDGSNSDIELTSNSINANIHKNYDGKRSIEIKVIAHSTLLGFRVGNIIKTININQESGLASFIRFDKDEIKVAKTLNNGDYYKVPVRTDGTSWEAWASDTSWIHFDVDIEQGLIRLRPVDNNTTVRSGSITVEDNNSHRAVIIIKQNGNPTHFELEANTIISSVYGGTYTIGVDTDNIDDLSVDVLVGNFISAEINENYVIIRVEENYSSPHRGTVYVRCGDRKESIIVEQQGYKECNRCHGSGKVLCRASTWTPLGWQHFFTNTMGQQIPCPYCNSMGSPGRIECKNCEGEGRIIADYVE